MTRSEIPTHLVIVRAVSPDDRRQAIEFGVGCFERPVTAQLDAYREEAAGLFDEQFGSISSVVDAVVLPWIANDRGRLWTIEQCGVASKATAT